MSTIRVISGEYGGRVIPFSLGRYGNADITPQKIKGALFSILGEELSGRSFLDLFGCSGQVGVEALSRGADPVVIVEHDRRRFNFIRDFLDELDAGIRARSICAKAEKALGILEEEGMQFDIIFCDPPYDKVKGKTRIYTDLLDRLQRHHVLKPDGIVVIQHFGSNVMPQEAELFRLRETRLYGTNGLSFYLSST